MFDEKFIQFAQKYYGVIARASLFIIFFYFGFLKLIGVSPASPLAEQFTATFGLGVYFDQLFLLIALVECAIGIMFLIPKLTRITILIMFLHMLLVSAPLFVGVEGAWARLFVPTLEGQYIIKNAALVALALGLVARTQPIKTT